MNDNNAVFSIVILPDGTVIRMDNRTGQAWVLWQGATPLSHHWQLIMEPEDHRDRPDYARLDDD